MKKFHSLILMTFCLIALESNTTNVSETNTFGLYAAKFQDLKMSILNAANNTTDYRALDIINLLNANLDSLNHLTDKASSSDTTSRLRLLASSFTQIANTFAKIASMKNDLLNFMTTKSLQALGLNKKLGDIYTMIASDSTSLVKSLTEAQKNYNNAVDSLARKKAEAAILATQSQQNSLKAIKTLAIQYKDKVDKLVVSISKLKDSLDLLVYVLQQNSNTFAAAADLINSAAGYDLHQLDGLIDLSGTSEQLESNWTFINDLVNEVNSLGIS
jgi:hypothetical protein